MHELTNRIGDSNAPSTLRDIDSLAARTADAPLAIPTTLPAQVPKDATERYTDSSVYPYLETNVHAQAMEFSQERFPSQASDASISLHGTGSPFRPWRAVRGYVQSLLERRGYADLVSYNTTVENAVKVGAEWVVTLRQAGEQSDYWWQETFDAIVVASGHYSVPYIPAIPGLEAFEKARPGSVIHSKQYRGRQVFESKRVVVVGASVSAADIAVDLVSTAKLPVYAITKGHNFNGYFGDEAFQHPRIENHSSIKSVCPVTRTVHLVDGASIPNVDHVIFGTGYSWTLPFLPSVPVRNNRVPDLYQHVVWQHDPSLLFVGAVAAGLTFKIFEWQAVLAARVLSARAQLPPLAEQRKWEAERIKARGDGVKFTLVFPDFEDYFEDVRRIAGPGVEGSRQLPAFKREWFRAFLDGHEMRKRMWRRKNAQARAEIEASVSEDARSVGQWSRVVAARARL